MSPISKQQQQTQLDSFVDNNSTHYSVKSRRSSSDDSRSVSKSSNHNNSNSNAIRSQEMQTSNSESRSHHSLGLLKQAATASSEHRNSASQRSLPKGKKIRRATSHSIFKFFGSRRESELPDSPTTASFSGKLGRSSDPTSSLPNYNYDISTTQSQPDPQQQRQRQQQQQQLQQLQVSQGQIPHPQSISASLASIESEVDPNILNIQHQLSDFDDLSSITNVVNNDTPNTSNTNNGGGNGGSISVPMGRIGSSISVVDPLSKPSSSGGWRAPDSWKVKASVVDTGDQLQTLQGAFSSTFENNNSNGGGGGGGSGSGDGFNGFNGNA
ncbi:unnamed protein product [Ambrosiozyma monospora]|uniref:Unnamed protein product n=1 Tax=Ambrosiozyma monospora TaxID=43982 RepID=A0ACB5TC71_AMBMO|nr:unnamed protein product [Ambrosiozyma monospora]